MSKKTDKILGRKPGRKQTLNIKRAAILGKPLPGQRSDEEERDPDGKCSSGGGGTPAKAVTPNGAKGAAKPPSAKRPKSEMSPNEEKVFAKAAMKLPQGKPGLFDEPHGKHGTDPDSLVDSADHQDEETRGAGGRWTGAGSSLPTPSEVASAHEQTRGEPVNRVGHRQEEMLKEAPRGGKGEGESGIALGENAMLGLGAADINHSLTGRKAHNQSKGSAVLSLTLRGHAKKKDGILGRKDWDESQHPRDKGKFSAGQGGGDLAGQGAGAKELHGMAQEAKARAAVRAAASKQERGKLVGTANAAIRGAEGAAGKAHAALAELRNRAGIHPAVAGKAAKAAEEHAAVLKEAASHTKDPAHAQIAAKADMHAKAARESAQKAVKAATPVAAAHHAASAKVSASKAEDLREHMTREIGKKADKEEREGRAPKAGEGGGEGADAPQGHHHLLPLRELWQLLIGK